MISAKRSSGRKACGGGHQQDVLGQDVQPAGAGWIAVQLAGGDALHGGLAFQDFEPVGGHQDGAAGFVHSVVGPPNAL